MPRVPRWQSIYLQEEPGEGELVLLFSGRGIWGTERAGNMPKGTQLGIREPGFTLTGLGPGPLLVPGVLGRGGEAGGPGGAAQALTAARPETPARPGLGGAQWMLFQKGHSDD